jgi:protein-disulfide isomerase
VSRTTANELPPVDERDHVLGADQPVVTLVEYGDFGCPHCFAAKRPIESLLDR